MKKIFRRPDLVIFCLTFFTINTAQSENSCANLNKMNFKSQVNGFSRLSDGLFSDPTNCAFQQAPKDAQVVDKGITPEKIKELLTGSTLFSKQNNPAGDEKQIINDLFSKIQSSAVKSRIELMRKQLGCKNVEIEYSSDGPATNITNFKKSFSSDLNKEDLLKYHRIDVSEYTKVGNRYLIKDQNAFDREVDKFISKKNASDRPVYVCTERQDMQFESNTPPPKGIDFSDSFVTGLPSLSNELEAKEKICNEIKNLKTECIKSINISTSSDRRSNCDRSKNIINSNGENECPYVSGQTIGRNDFSRLSKDRADKLEQLVKSCVAGNNLKGKISKDSSGLRGDGSSGLCPYQVTNLANYNVKIKPEYLKGGSSVEDLNLNRYARINIESTRVQGCGGYGKAVEKTTTVSIKCLKIQAKCVP